jgi:hypothetical protein
VRRRGARLDRARGILGLFVANRSKSGGRLARQGAWYPGQPAREAGQEQDSHTRRAQHSSRSASPMARHDGSRGQASPLVNPRRRRSCAGIARGRRWAECRPRTFLGRSGLVGYRGLAMGEAAASFTLPPEKVRNVD